MALVGTAAEQEQLKAQLWQQLGIGTQNMAQAGVQPQLQSAPVAHPAHAQTPLQAAAQLPPRPQPPPSQQTSTSTPGTLQSTKTGGSAKKSGAPGARLAEVTPARKSKKRKATDKQVMEQVASFLPESAAYTRMLEMERRIDRCLAHKKLDIQEALQKPDRVERVLRLYLFNTHINQPAGNRGHGEEAAAPRHSDSPPAWTFNMCGRLLDQEQADEPMTSAAARKPGADLKFTQLIKAVTIELDPEQYPGPEGKITWDWDKHNGMPTDGFEVKRCGARDVNAKISITLDYTPNRFRLSDELASLLGTSIDTRPNIISALWQYIKSRKLQSEVDPSTIICDAALANLFGESEKTKVKMVQLASRILPHLQVPPPLEFTYTIRCGGSPKPECYDVTVDVPSHAAAKAQGFLARLERSEEAGALSANINACIKKIGEHKRRRAFFLGFSHSPVDFINGLIASQSRDLKTIAAGDSQDLGLEHRSDFYKKPWVDDAVIKYLYRQAAAGQG